MLAYIALATVSPRRPAGSRRGLLPALATVDAALALCPSQLASEMSAAGLTRRALEWMHGELAAEALDGVTLSLN